MVHTEIMPITDLRHKTEEVINHVQKERGLVYITQHGRPSVVLIDYDRYEALLTTLQKLQTEQKQHDAIALLQSWADEGDEKEQQESGEALIKGLSVPQKVSLP